MKVKVTATAQRLMKDMTPGQIEKAVRKYKESGSTTSSSQMAVHGNGKMKALVRADVSTKAARPLNSWIAFRTYYKIIFKNLQQKDISGYLTYMWQSDPFKAKWSVLAKAYSVIRDKQGKQLSPLDAFLAINVSLVGIIEPDHYMKAVGWSIHINNDGATEMLQVEAQIDANLLASNISVNDIIRNAFMFGYIKVHLSDVLIDNDQAALTTARTSQHTQEAEAGSSNRSTDQDVVHENASGTKVSSNEGVSRSSNVAFTNASTQEDEGTNDEDQDVEEDSEDEDSGNSAPTSADTVSSANDAPGTASQVMDSDVVTGNIGSVDDRAPVETMTDVPSTTQLQEPERLSPKDFQNEAEMSLNEAFDPINDTFLFDPFSGNHFDAFEVGGGWEAFVNWDEALNEREFE